MAGKRRIVLLIGLIAVISLMLPIPAIEAAVVDPEKITETEVDEMKVSITYNVDINHKNKSDQNDGTADMPFATIGHALRKAAANRKENKGTKIIIKPGVYREVLRVEKISANPDAPIIIEGTDKNDVFVRGSIIMQDPWVKEGDYYTHDWALGWKPSRDIYEEYNIFLDEIIRRKELIHVNGVRMTQVMKKEDLKPGKMFVDNDEKKAYFMPYDGMEVKADSVEVSIYEEIMGLHETGDFMIKNITFEHANSYHASSAVSIYKVSNIVFEDCDILSNNWAALGIFDAKNTTIDRVRMNGNGGVGINGAGNDNLLIRDSETSGNNWRGVLGNFCDWDTAGIKLLFTYDCAIIRHQAYNNFASGIWFDSECRNIVIQECIVIGNDHPGNSVAAGLYIEGNLGPISISDCIVRENHRGLNLASSNDVTIRNTQVVNNRLEQVATFGNWGQGRSFKARFEEGDATSFPLGNILDNVVISAGPDNTEPLISFDHSDKGGYVIWTRATTWNNVSVHHPSPDKMFLLDDSETRGSLEQWTAAFGHEVKWVPASPLELKMEKKDRDVDLSWGRPNDDIEGYVIYFNGKELARTSSTEYKHTLESGIDRGTYEVASYKGDAVSGRSNCVFFQPEGSGDGNTDNGQNGGASNPGNSAKKQPISTKNLILLLSIIAVGLIFGFGAAIGISMKKTMRKKR